MTFGRRIGTVNPVAVQLPRPQAGNVHMPDVIGAGRQWDDQRFLLGRCVRKQTQLNTRRMPRERRKVDAFSVPEGTQRMGAARSQVNVRHRCLATLCAGGSRRLGEAGLRLDVPSSPSQNRRTHPSRFGSGPVESTPTVLEQILLASAAVPQLWVPLDRWSRPSTSVGELACLIYRQQGSFRHNTATRTIESNCLTSAYGRAGGHTGVGDLAGVPQGLPITGWVLTSQEVLDDPTRFVEHEHEHGTAALSTSLGMAGPAPDARASAMGHWPVCLPAGHRVCPTFHSCSCSAQRCSCSCSNPAAVYVHPGPTHLSGFAEMCVTTRLTPPAEFCRRCAAEYATVRRLSAGQLLQSWASLADICDRPSFDQPSFDQPSFDQPRFVDGCGPAGAAAQWRANLMHTGFGTSSVCPVAVRRPESGSMRKTTIVSLSWFSASR